MREVELRGVWAPPLQNVSITFARGLNVVLGGMRDGTAELIAVCSGTLLPRRGSAQLGSELPASSPQARRVVASLLATESLTGTPDVRSWLGQLSALKGFDTQRSVAELCPALALERSLSSLSAAEQRQLALAVALGDLGAELLVLHEPLAALQSPFRELALERLRELSERTTVVVATASLDHARQLGGRSSLLERGVLTRGTAAGWPESVTSRLGTQLWVDCAAPRELLAQLIASPDVEAATFDGGGGDGRIHVAGRDLERLCLALARAAVAARAGVRSLQLSAPDLAMVHGTSSALARAAQGGARRAERREIGGSAAATRLEDVAARASREDAAATPGTSEKERP